MMGRLQPKTPRTMMCHNFHKQIYNTKRVDIPPCDPIKGITCSLISLSQILIWITMSKNSAFALSLSTSMRLTVQIPMLREITRGVSSVSLRPVFPLADKTALEYVNDFELYVLFFLCFLASQIISPCLPFILLSLMCTAGYKFLKIALSNSLLNLFS